MGNDENIAKQDAAAAFEQLRREVSLLRRGVEALTAERQAQPDYTATLLDLDRRLEEVRRWARKISERPALELTPAEVAKQIEAASARAIEAQRAETAQSRSALEQAIKGYERSAARVRGAAEQWRWLVISSTGSLLIGAVIGVWTF